MYRPTAQMCRIPTMRQGGRRQSRRLPTHRRLCYVSILPNGELPRSAADFPSVFAGSAQFSHKNKLSCRRWRFSSFSASVAIRCPTSPSSGWGFCYRRLHGVTFLCCFLAVPLNQIVCVALGRPTGGICCAFEAMASGQRASSFYGPISAPGPAQQGRDVRAYLAQDFKGGRDAKIFVHAACCHHY
jgi:hypothetical protein